MKSCVIKITYIFIIKQIKLRRSLGCHKLKLIYENDTSLMSAGKAQRTRKCYTSADLEVQLVQLNHCGGVYSNY